MANFVFNIAKGTIQSQEPGAVAIDNDIAVYLEGKPILENAFEAVLKQEELNVGIRRFFDREDFNDEVTPLLRGIATFRPAREYMDRYLQKHFESTIRQPGIQDEVVIGAGLHGAIYVASRAKGYETGNGPLVIERSNKVGGSFAQGSFYLNSRNRPKKPGLPGQESMLNYIPGALIQPHEVSGAEYQTNEDFAFVIRLNLALLSRGVLLNYDAKVRANTVQGNDNFVVEDTSLRNGSSYSIDTQRVVFATGLGPEQQPTVTGAFGTEAITFFEFMGRIDRLDFPTENINKVAVVGAGDGGNVAVEYLLGQGPQAPLDYIERIDWYGQGSQTKEEFECVNRSRYAGIARYMPREGQPNYYVRVFPRTRVYDERDINIEDYDLVIWATGFVPNSAPAFDRTTPEWLPIITDDNAVIARKVAERELYWVGPGINAPLTSQERQVRALNQIPSNSVAAFRYAQRTEALAVMLP